MYMCGFSYTACTNTCPILCVRYELNDPNLPHAGTRTSTVDDSIVGAGLYEKAGTKLSIPNNTHTKMNGYIKVLVDEHSF